MHPRVDESFDDLNDDDDDDYYDDEADMIETTDDMLIPPSPPRSPPKEIDPDMLYGLYDFNGPDPSHCTLARNEPVILVNDQDNYWWLIRKLTKVEKIAHRLKHKRISGYNIDDLDNPGRPADRTSEYTELDDEHIMSDEEDGKTGFVPAECLETFGERLARLNCYKNEELERSGASLNVVKPVQKAPSSKTVMFDVEETPKLECSLSDDNDSDQEFPSEFYDHRHIAKSLLEPPSGHGEDEDKASEVLSDLYPANVELVVKKKKNNMVPADVPVTAIKSRLVDTSSSLITPLRGAHSEDNLPYQLESLTRLGNKDEWKSFEKPSSQTFDDISIGSFSPDTPVSEFAKNRSPRDPELQSTPLDSEVNTRAPVVEEESQSPSSIIRRSLILDRLNQVTSDIQQLQLNDYEAFNEQDENDLLHWKNSNHETKSLSGTVAPIEQEEEIQLSSFNPYAQAGRSASESPVRSVNSPTSNQLSPQFESESRAGECEIENEDNDDEDDFDTCDINGIRGEARNSNEVITPLTLTNSLTSGVKTGKASVSTLSTREDDKTDTLSNCLGSSLSLELGKLKELTISSSSKELSSSRLNDSACSVDITKTSVEVPESIIGNSPAAIQTPTDTIMSGRRNSWKELTPSSQFVTPGGGESTDALPNTLESTSRYSPEASGESKESGDNGEHIVDSSIDSLMFMDIINSRNTGEELPQSYLNPTAFELLLPEGEESQMTSLRDKRKSKPVHDMFVPVLDKFDDLAKKLAELDDLL